MNRRSFLAALPVSVVAGSLLTSCRNPESTTSNGMADAAQVRTTYRPDLFEIFRDAGIDGTFVMLGPEKTNRLVVNETYLNTGFLPASTFKVPNTLIALELGVATDGSFPLPWDGVERSIDVWNKDHTLESAIKVSAVWYYQELARRIGRERYTDYLERLDYGNRDISGPVDEFWLTGNIRISPMQQAGFFWRLAHGSLPVSSRSTEILRQIITKSTKDGVTVYAKTGLGNNDPYKVGWLGGWVERPDGIHSFASLALGPVGDTWDDSPVMPARASVALKTLESIGVIPKDMPPLR